MTGKRLLTVTIVTVVGLAASTGLQAQQYDATSTSSEVAELCQRLDAAERQIGQLQNELFQAKAVRSPSSGLYHLTSSYDADEEANGSESTDVAQELEDLKSSVADLESANEDIESALKTFVNVGTSKATIKLSGRLHGDYWAFPGADPGIAAFEGRDPEDRFVARRIRFGVAGKITDHMEYKIEAEFADPNDTEWRDVYLGFNDLPILRTLLIGNQKRPYGLDHLNSSRYNVFIERPFIIEVFSEDARRLGVV